MKRAFSPATAKSQQATRLSPAPAATPFTMAITGASIQAKRETAASR
ncbi:MAG: hypothetical protein BWY79_02050 [Actinobacteria bacterium ADurb.Bin444]|nr:MAG: hypothetical protein BWY79_02050 [Actinobacteria bacterium ADurb.Bin444]